MNTDRKKLKAERLHRRALDRAAARASVRSTHQEMLMWRAHMGV
ncbi:hypothetical protein [Actinorhabdospora filicis]|nr:hypothetical protein [Actinorhabdospora filicis]